MKRYFSILACMLSLMPMLGQAQDDAASWLGRVAAAGQKLNYVGTFIYQSGSDMETSRIAHRVDGRGVFERLEVLDGSPREVIRANQQVFCLLPDQKIVIRDKAGKPAFPARLPSAYGELAEYYTISVAGTSRVAGFPARLIVLEPKDELRYGHMLWAEEASGLLLKSRTVGANGEVIEQFAFSDVSIGGDIAPDTLEPRYVPDGSWKEVNAQSSMVSEDEVPWRLQSPLPGYELKSSMRRNWGRNGTEVLHLVFSDGLASISVFIEERPPEDEHAWSDHIAQNGAINIYKRRLDGQVITALGEVPQQAVRQIADSIYLQQP